MGLEGGLSEVKDSASLDGIKVLILKGSNFEFVSLSKKKKIKKLCIGNNRSTQGASLIKFRVISDIRLSAVIDQVMVTLVESGSFN